jgi:hypothetical protein
MLPKKREVLKYLNKSIESLVEMSADAAKLEYTDNEQASKRLKLAISRFKHEGLKDLERCVFGIREHINVKKGRKDRAKHEALKTENMNFLQQQNQ